MSDIKIFVTHTPNRNAVRLERPFLFHVIAGSVYQKNAVPSGMYLDSQGEHISEKNKSYCELTTQYWAWKNQDADYYGFCHYRRFFSFRESRIAETSWGTAEYDWLDEEGISLLKLEEAQVQKVVEPYDFLIAKGIDTKKLGADSVYRHYEMAPELQIRDLDLFLRILEEKYPFLWETAQAYVKGNIFYPCNMFIMKKELFAEYCTILFDVLAEFEKRSDMENYSREGYRTTGHLGERMAGIYYQYLQRQKVCRLGELQIALIHNTDTQGPFHPPQCGAVPVVLAANQAYVPILYVCMQSLIEHADQNRRYEVFVFHADICPQSQELFQTYLAKDHIRIRFVNVKSRVAGYKLKAKQHITTETFYRFLILDILRDYPKVIYLDCDLILCRDAAELYDTPLADCLLAAARDPDFAGQCNMPGSEMRTYCSNTLGMQDPFAYFQAGVLVLQVDKLRQVTSVAQLLQMSDTGIYRFSDQDILNVICEGKVMYLDMAWNMLFDCDDYRWKHVIRFAPHAVLDEYEQARKAPYIVHFAGFRKPWMQPGQDFGHVFWETARKTIFYEQLLGMLYAGQTGGSQGQTCGVQLNWKGKLLVFTKKIAKAVLPESGKLRDYAVRVYLRIVSR